MTTHKPLGKGLAALLGEEENSNNPEKGVNYVPLKNIIPCADQPRKNFKSEELESLSLSIKEKGILQPILIKPHPTSAGKYEIIAGERRWRAASMAGLEEVPVILHNVSANESLEIALIENIQRLDLNAMEEAEGYQKLIHQYNYTQDNLAKVIGKSRSHIANMLRLNTLSDKVKGYVRENLLSAGHARSLVNCPNAEVLAEDIIENQYSVREAEELIRKDSSSPRRKAKPKDKIKDGDILRLEEDLNSLLKMAVGIEMSDKEGKITIHFKDMEELNEIVSRLQGEYY